MNKQSIIPTLLALVSMAGQGQEIKRVTATPEDFMEHMPMYGYEVFTYDISSLRDSPGKELVFFRCFEQHYEPLHYRHHAVVGFTASLPS